MTSQIKLIENTAIPLVPVDAGLSTFPIALTSTYQDIPQERVINVKGACTAGFWIRVSGGNSVKLRVQATYEEIPQNYYNLPIQLVGAASVGMQPQMFELTLSGDYNFVFSVPIYGLIKYIKLQVKGNGQLDDAKVSFTVR